jgi:hypothetical protein
LDLIKTWSFGVGAVKQERGPPPHDKSELYCKRCGSSFSLVEINGNPGHVITSQGLAKVIGSDVPDLEDLSNEELQKLWRKYKKIARNSR